MLIEALQNVFVRRSYVILASFIAVIVFAFTVWLPNARLIYGVATDAAAPLMVKFMLPLYLLESITTNFTPLSASYTVAIAILFGIEVAMVTYFLKRRTEDARQGGMVVGAAGLLSGIIGSGCAACGSFILMSGISLFGAGSALALLPLHGAEFGVLGVALLSLSIYLTAKKLTSPFVCTT